MTTMILDQRVDVTDPQSLRTVVTPEKWLKPVRAFFEGDHWQDGEGWIGPMPSQSHEAYQEVLGEIAKTFTPHNVVAEIVERHAVGVIGREPVFGFTPRRAMKQDEKPSQEEQKLIDEAEAIMTVWWNAKGAHAILREAVMKASWANRGPLRLYVPPGRLLRKVYTDGRREELVIRVKTVEEALEYIFPESLNPENATVYEDPESKHFIGIYLHKKPDGQEYIEATWSDGTTTFIRIFNQTDTQEQAPLQASLRMNGLICMYEIRRPSRLVTDPILAQQKALNLASSMLPRNVISGGFLERVILNAQMPGHFEGEGDARKFIPDPLYVGAGTTNSFTGVEYTETDPLGNEKTRIANPSVQWREPVDTSPTIRTVDQHYKLILEEADQAHILIQGEAIASGKSREQARADFISSLGLTREPAETGGRWLIEAALAMAENFAGTPGHFTSRLRATFGCRLDSGPLSADEKRQLQEAGEKNYISRQTAQEGMGVDDVDAENVLISGQPGYGLSLIGEQEKAIMALMNLGFPAAEAFARVGMKASPEIIAAVQARHDKQLKAQEEGGNANPGNGNRPPGPGGRTSGGRNGGARKRTRTSSGQ